MSSNMISSSSSAATIAALPNSSPSTEQRFSQTSTAVATPCPLTLGAPTIGTDIDFPGFEYEVFQTRDSLEIARTNLRGRHRHQVATAPRCETSRSAFPFGRNSLELAHRELARRARSQQRELQQQQQQQQSALDDLRAQVPAATPAHVFLRTLGSRFAEDRAAMLTDPVLDYELNHRDSLSLTREKRALSDAANRRNARKPAQRLVAKAKAAKAALSGFAGKCFHGEADRSTAAEEEDVEKLGLLLE
jgi:hypothetical protein